MNLFNTDFKFVFKGGNLNPDLTIEQAGLLNLSQIIAIPLGDLIAG
jgi:hypothetical protein